MTSILSSASAILALSFPLTSFGAGLDCSVTEKSPSGRVLSAQNISLPVFVDRSGPFGSSQTQAFAARTINTETFGGVLNGAYDSPAGVVVQVDADEEFTQAHIVIAAGYGVTRDGYVLGEIARAEGSESAPAVLSAEDLNGNRLAVLCAFIR